MSVRTDSDADSAETAADPDDETQAPPAKPGGITERAGALIALAKDDAPRYVAAAVLATLGTVCQLAPFYLIYVAISDVLAGAASRQEMFTLAGLAMVFIVAHFGLLAASTLVSHRAAFDTLYHLRIRLGKRLGRAPLGAVTGKRSGEIQRSLADDVERLEAFLAHAIPDVVAAVVVVAATTIWMVVVDWRMALAAIACLVVSVLLSGTGVRRSQAMMGDYLTSMSRMNGSIVEMVRGMPIVRTFNRTGDTFAETRDAIRAAADYQANWGLKFLPLFTGFFTLAAAPALTIVPTGLLLWSADAIATPELLFFFVIGLGYGSPVVKLVQFAASATQLSYGAQVVSELDTVEQLPEAEATAAANDGSVEFRSACFRYDGSHRDAVTDVSFRAEPRSITALVGPSGAGKSTVARLICRFADVESGSILVGGTDVRDIGFSDLMDRVAFVFQETFLFDDTIEANLRLAKPDAGTEEIESACRAARAHEFITTFADGYQTRVGAQGTRLSGGQRQRIAIARALLKSTDIVVLDEATAFVDPENEVALQEAINALVEDRTVIMVAHRLSTIAGARTILVFDRGRIVERGRHQELVAANGLYARMWAAFESAENTSLGAAVHAAPSERDEEQA